MRSIPTAALLLIGLSTPACRAYGPAEARQVMPELTMEGVHFWIDRGGSTRARGVADRITYRRDTTAAAASTMSLTMSGAEGEVRLTAPTASGVVGERRFEASGGLVAERGADRAVTESASYEPAPSGVAGAGKVHGSDPVTVTGPGYQLDGRHGFSLDPTSGLIVLGGGARLVTGLPVKK
jgi:hypothetical protein